MNELVLLEEIKKNIGYTEYENVIRFTDSVINQLGIDNIENKRIVVGFGGGKDSSWTVSFIRTSQLLCKVKYGKTFHLDVVTMAHLGMLKPVYDNIHSVYSALQMYNKENISLIIYSYGQVSVFNKVYSIPDKIKNILRDDIMIFANLTYADARSTFCYSCNFHMVNSFLSVIKKNSFLFLSGDSKEEIANYSKWIKNLFTLVESSSEESNNLKLNIRKFFDLNKYIYLNIFSDDDDISKRIPEIDFDNITENFAFKSIHDYTNYEMEEHSEFLEGFLGFKFFEESFNFSESDCIYPMIMAHIRGIKSEIDGRDYKNGIYEYLQLTNALMVQKNIPDKLISIMVDRYGDTNKILLMKRKAEQFLKNINISDKHLITAIYSPFLNEGQNLNKYLTEIHPEYIKYENNIHQCLCSFETCKEPKIEKLIEDISGLNIDYIKRIYNYKLGNGKIKNEFVTILDYIRDGDPHKHKILINKNDSIVTKIISGR